MTRSDGRAFDEHRSIIAEFDSLNRVDGSARFGFGSRPSALVSFTGPVEVRLAAENPSQLSLDVLVRPLCGIPGVHEKRISATLASILKRSLLMEASPRTAVVVVAQIMSNEPSVTSIINAASMASMSAASVPMRGVVCAISVARTDGEFLLDPSPEELQKASASGSFAFHIQGTQRKECVWTDWHGNEFNEEDLAQAQTLASDAILKVWAVMKGAVRSREGFDSEEELRHEDAEMEI
ncbi:hypothetical protein CYLTODRAFT_451572 [Cylindrobasidium torrendii FP15055 ss-10]|uniref:Uncharacterized protein n=1 Tax=Cylindrobasidium torrendii FP15055 ss-10 TaxID=1314674 RepID=A0A0D7BJW3_9AGAR|nr:hypothetical protein CYLTODRAFT_451572 [Cylindrobasidium torrendii FP15055 ss-10]